jgi:hypothetical protein
MNYFSELTEKKNMPQTILAVLFVIYLVLGLRMPQMIAQFVDTTVGKVVVSIVALMLFAYSNPILGVLGLLVAYQIIRSSSVRTGMAALEEYYPTEEKKWTPFSAAHQFPYTLEQEVVKNMTTQKFNANYVKAPYRPALDDTHDAAPLSGM